MIRRTSRQSAPEITSVELHPLYPGGSSASRPESTALRLGTGSERKIKYCLSSNLLFFSLFTPGGGGDTQVRSPVPSPDFDPMSLPGGGTPVFGPMFLPEGGVPQSLVPCPFWGWPGGTPGQDRIGTGVPPGQDWGPPRDRLRRGRYASCGFPQEDLLVSLIIRLSVDILLCHCEKEIADNFEAKFSYQTWLKNYLHCAHGVDYDLPEERQGGSLYERCARHVRQRSYQMYKGSTTPHLHSDAL